MSRYAYILDNNLFKDKPTKLPTPPINTFSEEEFDFYTVKNNEDLHTIAKRFYDDEKKYYIILNANLDKIKDYFELTNGIVLKIPKIGA